MKDNVLILGAGISGLVAARELKDHGVQVSLVDKGRGVGGRLATRRTEENGNVQGRWDHGAQFVTFRDTGLKKKLEAWGALASLEPWIPSHSGPGLWRHCPPEGMNQFAKSLAEGLEIHRGERISRICLHDREWCLNTDQGDPFTSGQLISTVPLPQFLELAEASGLPLTTEERSLLQTVTYARCLSLLVETDGSSGLEPHGYTRVNSGILDTIIDQHLKGISASHTLVAHATPAFSREWYDRDRPTAASVIRAAVQEKIQSGITRVQIHGWKYARPLNRISRPSVQLKQGMYLAGDGFHAGTSEAPPSLHPRIESAMLSGLSAAEQILRRQKS